MAGVGKLLKQAQKMQRSIESLQQQLEAKEFDITAGGGAVRKLEALRTPPLESALTFASFTQEGLFGPKIVVKQIRSA